jgi:ABC-2 type transport system ATP-binding protein
LPIATHRHGVCAKNSLARQSPPLDRRPGDRRRIVILAAGRVIADGSADELTRQLADRAEVRWTHDGQRFVHATTEATKFVHDLFHQYGDAIGELDVRRASLEDTYLTLVHRAESGAADLPARSLAKVTR